MTTMAAARAPDAVTGRRWGVPRGGLTTKIHLAADSRCRPRTRPGRVLADKAYSSRAIRAHLRRRHIKATIPEPADQVAGRTRRGSQGGQPPAFDRQTCKQRNVVERAIGRLRLMRAVATRYDKRDFVYRGSVDVATIRIWLRDPVINDPRDTL